MSTKSDDVNNGSTNTILIIKTEETEETEEEEEEEVCIEIKIQDGNNDNTQDSKDEEEFRTFVTPKENEYKLKTNDSGKVNEFSKV